MDARNNEQPETIQLSPETYQQVLAENLHKFVVCEFLVGTSTTKSIGGVLESVGNSFFTLRDPCTNIQILCDIYSLKFIYIYSNERTDTEE